MHVNIQYPNTSLRKTCFFHIKFSWHPRSKSINYKRKSYSFLPAFQHLYLLSFPTSLRNSLSISSCVSTICNSKTNERPFKCPQMKEWINKMNYFLTTEYHLIVKMNLLQLHTKTQVISRNRILRIFSDFYSV